jgi:hypothetical protein
MKDGKKPISEKIPQSNFLLSDDDLGNMLAIPPDIKEELAAKGLVGRWLNGAELAKNQGYHRRGWQVYKRDKSHAIMDFKLGSDPEGLVRRGDCILGVKAKDAVTKQQAFLRQASLRKSATEASAKAELQRSFKAAGIKTSVVSGYDEE